MALLFEVTQTAVSQLEGLGSSVALGLDTSELLALIAVLVASVLGFSLPLVSAVSEFGQLTHTGLALLGCGNEDIGVMVMGSEEGPSGVTAKEWEPGRGDDLKVPREREAMT